MKNQYCCFNCTNKSEKEETLKDDVCPNCGLKYDYPLESYPEMINEYEIIEPRGRGFYAATFKARTGKFKSRFYALKVIPKEIYAFFGKDFEKECELHDVMAEESQHIVAIETYFDANIQFGEKAIDCHVAVLEFIDGDSIEEIIEHNIPLKPEKFTQIVIDLFSILIELKQRLKKHNDLHEGNIIIQELKSSNYRLDAIDPTIRAKAIDINSAQESEETNLDDRPRDIQRVSRIIRAIYQKVFINPDLSVDLNYRAAMNLLGIVYELDTKEDDYRDRDLLEIIETIKTEFEESQIGSPPWDMKFKLNRINDFYNAQALKPWFVSSLFVDPEDKWLTSISAPGPQLITGMRGCGKTILLKSLQFHARAVSRNGEEKSKSIKRLENDGYIGLYVSSSRLIDTDFKSASKFPLSVLFIGYIQSAIQAIRHLSDIDSSLIVKSYHKKFIKLILDIIPNSQEIKEQSITDSFLNYELERMQYSLLRGEKKYQIKIKPIITFENLAKTIKKTSTIWQNHHVFFLLDDVSTRYVEGELIKKLISQLLVQNEDFSFKITSEEHIIGYLLRSPGNIEMARPGRDYQLYDFGKQVNEAIHGKFSKNRKGFVEDILKKRLNYIKISTEKKNYFPRLLLGNVTLKSIALKIAKAKKTSPERKKVYHGFSALTAICVGDIGDIINIYDRFVSQSKEGNPLTVSEQTKIYLDFSSHRLYDLNRLKPDMKKYVFGFAEASHELLVESVKKKPGKNKKEPRIRQYNKIYISITSQSEDEQNKMLVKINRMIDAGVFVSSGLAFRSKPHHTNPLLQFTLTFKKLFGLSNYIGLSERDRFELKDKNLQDWLEHPDKCKSILKRNLSSKLFDEDDYSDVEEDDIEIIPKSKKKEKKTIKPKVLQKTIFDEMDMDYELFKPILPNVKSFSKPSFLSDVNVDELVLGLGFEERALASIKTYSNLIQPKNILLVRYIEKGYSDEIIKLLSDAFPKSKIIDKPYEKLSDIYCPRKGSILIDIGGLSKAIIFNIVRSALINNNLIYVCHTKAKSYYPTNQELDKVYNADKNKHKDVYKFIDSLSNILGGEKPPYKEIDLLKSESNVARNRVLIAFAKPKNERLYHILDNRDYDSIELITPEGHSSTRSNVARMTAELVCKKYSNANLNFFDSNDIKGVLNFMAEKYHQYYVDFNYNVEIALTGSKRQTIAAAILSSICKFSKVWYIKPSEIDIKRFSKGVGGTNFIQIGTKNIKSDN